MVTQFSSGCCCGDNCGTYAGDPITSRAPEVAYVRLTGTIDTSDAVPASVTYPTTLTQKPEIWDLLRAAIEVERTRDTPHCEWKTGTVGQTCNNTGSDPSQICDGPGRQKYSLSGLHAFPGPGFATTGLVPDAPISGCECFARSGWASSSKTLDVPVAPTPADFSFVADHQIVTDCDTSTLGRYTVTAHQRFCAPRKRAAARVGPPPGSGAWVEGEVGVKLYRYGEYPSGAEDCYDTGAFWISCGNFLPETPNWLIATGNIEIYMALKRDLSVDVGTFPIDFGSLSSYPLHIDDGSRISVNDSLLHASAAETNITTDGSGHVTRISYTWEMSPTQTQRENDGTLAASPYPAIWWGFAVQNPRLVLARSPGG